MRDLVWRKSSRSGDNAAQCVEVASLFDAVAIRDSKDPDGPKVLLSPAAFHRFAEDVKLG